MVFVYSFLFVCCLLFFSLFNCLLSLPTGSIVHPSSKPGGTVIVVIVVIIVLVVVVAVFVIVVIVVLVITVVIAVVVIVSMTAAGWDDSRSKLKHRRHLVRAYG